MILYDGEFAFLHPGYRVGAFGFEAIGGRGRRQKAKGKREVA